MNYIAMVVLERQSGESGSNASLEGRGCGLSEFLIPGSLNRGKKSTSTIS